MGEPKVNLRVLAPGERVGRFRIVEEIAQGGMASVYVARLSSIGGFGKFFALKVLHPHLRQDQAFVNMLLDEARIAALVDHPNVVQVIDIAEHEGTPYIAMELLRGRSLVGLIRGAAAAGQSVPLGTTIHVLSQVARGLHATHEARDETGRPLEVVHRDVSPQNIHVSFSGEVKRAPSSFTPTRRSTSRPLRPITSTRLSLSPSVLKNQGVPGRGADGHLIVELGRPALVGTAENLHRNTHDGQALSDDFFRFWLGHNGPRVYTAHRPGNMGHRWVHGDQPRKGIAHQRALGGALFRRNAGGNRVCCSSGHDLVSPPFVPRCFRHRHRFLKRARLRRDCDRRCRRNPRTG